MCASWHTHVPLHRMPYRVVRPHAKASWGLCWWDCACLKSGAERAACEGRGVGYNVWSRSNDTWYHCVCEQLSVLHAIVLAASQPRQRGGSLPRRPGCWSVRMIAWIVSFGGSAERVRACYLNCLFGVWDPRARGRGLRQTNRWIATQALICFEYSHNRYSKLNMCSSTCDNDRLTILRIAQRGIDYLLWSKSDRGTGQPVIILS